MQFFLQNKLKMADRVGYEKMLEEEMFPHLLTCNFLNLVEIKQIQNYLQFFIEKPYKKNK